MQSQKDKTCQMKWELGYLGVYKDNVAYGLLLDSILLSIYNPRPIYASCVLRILCPLQGICREYFFLDRCRVFLFTIFWPLVS